MADTDCVFLTGLHRAERAIADRLLTLNKGPLPWPRIDLEKAIPSTAQRTGLSLADSQKVAVGTALALEVFLRGLFRGIRIGPRITSGNGPRLRQRNIG
jgi:exodeoxyribonuclease V alpha subunit